MALSYINILIQQLDYMTRVTIPISMPMSEDFNLNHCTVKMCVKVLKISSFCLVTFNRKNDHPFGINLIVLVLALKGC